MPVRSFPMLDLAQPLPIPRLLRERLDRTQARLLHPNPERAVDFTRPAGEPALVGPDSVSWRVFKNPTALFVGGVAAVVLELAEPRVRAGVWDHSTFRKDPLRRMQRTGLAALVGVYGPRSTAVEMISGVVRMHDRVTGVASDGRAYSANDPELLTWVAATASYGFGEAYSRWAAPLSVADFDRFYAEGVETIGLYGAPDAPSTKSGVDRLIDSWADRLHASAELQEFLEIMAGRPLLPASMRALQAPMVRAAVDTLPAWAVKRLRLQRWRASPLDRIAVRAAGAAADRLVLDSNPAVQASVRLGLPRDYLYRR